LIFFTKQPTKRTTIGFASTSSKTTLTGLIEKSFACYPHKVTRMLSSLYEGKKRKK
jgi:hypothetical protein